MRYFDNYIDHRYVLPAIQYDPLITLCNVPMSMADIGYAVYEFLSTPYLGVDNYIYDKVIYNIENMVDINRNQILNNIEFSVLMVEQIVAGSHTPDLIFYRYCKALAPNSYDVYAKMLLVESPELDCIINFK
ncbi:MAG: hypothetical protein ACRCZ9_12235 [Fusobacteriaceae bacterium]